MTIASKPLDSFADILDSRDIIARIAYLEDTEDEDERKELADLKGLADDAEGYCDDWKYGAPLIRDSYFKEYAMELAEDVGSISGDEKWPLTCIDWGQAARELQQDYTSVEFDGVTYWVR